MLKYKKFLNFILFFSCISITTRLASADQIVEVNVLMPAPFADSTKEIIKDFNEKNKGLIKAKVTKGPLETEAMSDLAISSLLLGNSPYDVLLVDVTWLPKYAKSGWLYPLDQLFRDSNLDQIASGAASGNTYENILYRIPFVADIGLLYWRKDLMSKPPTTPKQLVELSKNLQKQGKVKYGYIWQGRQYEGLSCVFLEIVHGFGGGWLDKNNTIKLNSKETKEAVQWMKDLIANKITPESVTNFSEPESLQLFKNGEVAFMRNWPYAWSELQKPDSKVSGKVGITTMVSKDGISSTSTLGSWGFSILRTSNNKRASKEVINYLTSEDSQVKLFENFGYTPTLKKLFSIKGIEGNSEILPNLFKALQVTKARPQSPLYAQISDILQRQLSSILTNQISVDKGMEYAYKNTKKVLKSSGEDK